MESNEKLGHASKRALVSLRERLDKTQQSFAVEYLDCAVATVARYETSNPPRGDVLLKLGEIADANRFGELAAEFRFLYLDEILANLGFSLIVSGPSEKERHGYLVLKLDGQQQIDDAKELLHKRSGYKPGTDQFRDSIENAVFGRKRKAK